MMNEERELHLRVAEELFAAIGEETARLSTGGSMNTARWSQIVADADALKVGDDSPIGPFLSIARIASASTADEVSLEKESGPRERPLDLIADAFAAQRRIELGAETPQAIAERAFALFNLVSLHRDEEMGRRLVGRSVADYAASVTTMLRDGNTKDAIKHAISYVAAANTQARLFHVTDGLSDMLDLLFPLLENARGDVDFRAATSMNLTTTCSVLAQGEPDNRIRHLTNGIRAGKLAIQLIGQADSGDSGEHPTMRRQLIIGSYSAVLRFSVALAAEDRRNFAEHAANALQYSAEVRAIVDASDDAELRTPLIGLADALPSALRDIDPEWQPPSGFTELDTKAIVKDTEAIIDSLDPHIDLIDTATDEESRRRAIDVAIAPFFENARDRLLAQIREIGLNHRLCRILAAFGAVAGGKLGTLNQTVLIDWMSRVRDTEGSSRQREIMRRQQAFAPGDEQSMFALMQSVVVISAFADQLALRWQMRDDVATVLRNRFRSMLTEVLSAPGTTVSLDREIPSSADLRFVVESLPAAFRAEALEHYLGESANQTEQPAFQMPHRAYLSKSPDERKAEHAEEEKEKEPVIGQPALDELSKALSALDVKSPMDLIGVTVETETAGAYTVTSLLGRGESKIVLQLKHEQSGHTFALAYFTASQLVQLKKSLTETMQQAFDAEKVIDLCDRILALSPDEEVAHYNKGLALLTTSRFDESIDAFGRAVEIAPATCSTGFTFPSRSPEPPNQTRPWKQRPSRSNSIDPVLSTFFVSSK